MAIIIEYMVTIVFFFQNRGPPARTKTVDLSEKKKNTQKARNKEKKNSFLFLPPLQGQ